MTIEEGTGRVNAAISVELAVPILLSPGVTANEPLKGSNDTDFIQRASQ